MIRRLTFIFAAIMSTAAAAPASAALTAQLFPVTGEVRLLNKGETPVPFVFYSITSDSGALDSSNGVWTSITET